MGKHPTLTTTAGNHERDVRDFVVKFNTEQGNWDLVGNTTPVFFVRDPTSFPTSFTRRSRIPAPTCARQRRCGIFGRYAERSGRDRQATYRPLLQG